MSSRRCSDCKYLVYRNGVDKRCGSDCALMPAWVSIARADEHWCWSYAERGAEEKKDAPKPKYKSWSPREMLGLLVLSLSGTRIIRGGHLLDAGNNWMQGLARQGFGVRYAGSPRYEVNKPTQIDVGHNEYDFERTCMNLMTARHFLRGLMKRGYLKQTKESKGMYVIDEGSPLDKFCEKTRDCMMFMALGNNSYNVEYDFRTEQVIEKPTELLVDKNGERIINSSSLLEIFIWATAKTPEARDFQLSHLETFATAIKHGLLGYTVAQGGKDGISWLEFKWAKKAMSPAAFLLPEWTEGLDLNAVLKEAETIQEEPTEEESGVSHE